MILVFGKTGQVARELGKFSDVTCVGRDVADLMRPSACGAIIRELRPKAVINAAAFTAVDSAESAAELAEKVNADAPREMALASAEQDIPFIQISTDYVFSGIGETPWQPKDQATPINVYGLTKRAGEDAVIGIGGRYAILRTSWVFSATGANFVKTMLDLGRAKSKLSVVSDQFGGPTPARDIATACLELAKSLQLGKPASGIHHFAGTPDVSWADFAREIFRQSEISCEVVDVPSSAFPTKAARPKNSRLNCDSLNALNLCRPDWGRGLKDVLRELGEIR